MPLTRAAQQDREIATVRSKPGRDGYHCPDLAALDAHLRRLTAKLRLNLLTEPERRRYAEDVDALLLERHGMQNLAENPESAA